MPSDMGKTKSRESNPEILKRAKGNAYNKPASNAKDMPFNSSIFELVLLSKTEEITATPLTRKTMPASPRGKEDKGSLNKNAPMKKVPIITPPIHVGAAFERPDKRIDRTDKMFPKDQEIPAITP